MSATALLGKIRQSKIHIEILTAVQQYVYHITLRNVYEFKKWLMKSGLVYRYCCHWKEKSSPCLWLHNWPTFWSILLQAA